MKKPESSWGLVVATLALAVLAVIVATSLYLGLRGLLSTVLSAPVETMFPAM